MGGIVKHTIEPFIFKEAKVLILGTMPSPKSRQQGFYYGHPQNRFWRVLAAVFGEKAPEGVEDRKSFLKKHKIALWDVLRECEIEGASDSSIKSAIPNDVAGKIAGTDINAIFTTGKTAHDLLKKLTGTESLALPSPSLANCAVPFDEMVLKYSAIKRFL
ncbi:MAG: DNA-deoxyinosine glycosylase [Clostridia bacterium]|nr:DNA-deoxyinosine glycosylase [Clostridia bacterium]